MSEPRPLADLNPPDVVAPAADGQPARLIGGECRDCGARTFPTRVSCPRCLGGNVVPLPLGRRGTLYAYTTVHVSATRPVPYTIGYVDLPEGPRVLAGLPGDPARYHLDQQVSLVVETDGDRPAWAFVPAEPARPEGDRS
ncbi:OB-fold domain-containing protein [Micromonospora sp. WMMD1082]|uniref:Zn-ribbon domain-containing OB-fold protein n=1 Tax=Micromonospora sp. WMMD1082 TaxID=3016104 RepID=UPI002417722F|nr:OB-fold domain-containing protein [Micromonospora sp. WMMD1082]MDG4798338.1 OB-fold domain-containing protein [Micromonospora sp. WMMD1082]